MNLPNGFEDHTVCIVGLGYVGLTLAVAMSDTGFRVHGIDIRDDLITGLERCEAHFWEPRLTEKLNRVVRNGQFTFSRNIPEDFGATVFIITVGTPLDEYGQARLSMAEEATHQTAAAMKDGALVILRSTVKLGTAREVVQPILDASGKHFQLAFCPERTLEGRALIELHELPQIIGADDAETRWRCQKLFVQMTPTTIAVSSLESAELVKLVDNTYRDLTFGFANEIAKLCARSGISAREVIKAGKLGYPRTNVALPGPVGGPCLEKDPHILIESARERGVSMPITEAGRRTNEDQPSEIADVLFYKAQQLDGFSKTPRIALLGLAFKGRPATDDLRGTMAVPIYHAILERFSTACFCGFDPVISPDVSERFFGFEMMTTIEEAFSSADVVLILNNHESFRCMDLAALATKMNGPGIVYDLWNMHDDVNVAMPKGITALALGSENI